MRCVSGQVHRRRIGLHVACMAGILAGTARAADEAPRLIRRHCGSCHCDGAEEGGVSLDPLLEGVSTSGQPIDPQAADHATWLAVWRNLRVETMPPAAEPQPPAEERRRMLAFVQRDVLGVDPARPDPGRVVLRRLNRHEYANTVRDLTGFDAEILDDLPADDTGHGFDTIGDVLSLSPLLLEKYMALAVRVAERVAAARPEKSTKNGEGGPRYKGDVGRVFAAGPPPDDPAAREAHLRLTLRRLVERGYRRPVPDDTVDRLVALAAAAGANESFEKGVAAAVTAVLSSPRFLFRIESGDAPDADGAASAIPIDDHAIASRLSYLLWSTMPDDELFALAAAGRLREELPRQVDRMIADRRSDAFVSDFVGQWLQTRDVETLAFDARTVLGIRDREAAEKVFNGDVRRAMRRETEMLFAHVLREGLPATELLVGRRTFLNSALAGYYGLPDVEGKEMRLVDLPADGRRGGLLRQASFLVVTSNPTRTSPVKRGLFILDNLLGMPPPPAPAGIPPLETSIAAAGNAAGMRAAMELHRSDALCASCHARMDPLGLAFERYDAIGRFRDDEAAAALDTSGRLGGAEFSDAASLAELIAGPRRRHFHRCVTEKLLTYALGRGLEYFDGPAVDTIVESLERDGRLATLVHGVVASVPFQMRRPRTVPP